jgi:hypothetical protein
MELDKFVSDFASGLKSADSRRPQAINVRSKKPFQPGIGPHTESETVALAISEMRSIDPLGYDRRLHTGVPYPDNPRQKCDVCVGLKRPWQWAIEVKMLRMLGDNGKVNDNILMHILSP